LRVRRVLVIDGYNDEPGGLGVPPYVDVYPRLVAGALWLADSSIRVDYVTVDEFRSSKLWLKRASHYDVIAVIAGVVVPGKYIGGRPASPEEIILWGRLIEGLKVLVGPAAKWGMGLEGGRPAVSPSAFARAGYVLVRGDPEIYFYELALYGEEKARPYVIRRDYTLTNKALIKGARIVRQHPNYGRNLIVEIETYRGCARWISGGCSFCVEPLRGRPIQRDPQDIVAEVEALYRWGVRSFRLGRQADILVYGSRDLGDTEWPRPNPEALEKLLRGIRSVAPTLEVLHIDNVNPGTITRHPLEALKALKTIVMYHTDGDVAALGLESADPRVARVNNLNVTADEALEAIRVINRVGARRGPSGLPHLLPGINFILGLPGETRETYRLNIEFLEKVLDEGLLVRRVNIRKVMVIPATRLYKMWKGVNPRIERYAKSFVRWVRETFDKQMLLRIAPPGTILRRLWVEQCGESYCYARQVGSYPLTVYIPCRLPRGVQLDEVVVRSVHSPRSVLGVPVRVSIVELAGMDKCASS
jgi:radical SAM superfamily enzyme with C-terminal helix-hairpin-helix motif